MASSITWEVKSSTGKARADITGLFNQIAVLTKKVAENQVDWKKILFSTLSPAVLVGDLGRTLQLAVDATQEFEESVGAAAANAGGVFSGNTKIIGNAALQVTRLLGSSANENAAAIAYLSKTWGDNLKVMNVILEESAKASNIGFTDMSTAVQVFSQVLQSWGIRTADQAQNAIKALVVAVQNGNIPFERFAETLIASKAGLSAYNISLEKAAAALSALSTQSGMTASQAISVFTNFASVIQDKVNPQVLALLNNASGVLPALKTGELGKALTELETYFKKGGIAAAQIGIQAGISGDNIKVMSSLSQKAIDELTVKTDQLVNKMKELKDPLDQALTPAQELQKTWRQFKADLMTGPGDVWIQFFNLLLKVADKAISGSWVKDLLDAFGVTAKIDASRNIRNLVLDRLSSMFSMAGKAFGEVEYRTALSLLPKDVDKLSLLQSALLHPSPTNISTINNTFGINVSVTAGESATQISNAIVKALYQKFQGMGF